MSRSYSQRSPLEILLSSTPFRSGRHVISPIHWHDILASDYLFASLVLGGDVSWIVQPGT
ncbi:hypothetical protein BD309DRAFT_378251 [Dichomitus squalens]|nr:hypothetical protein BD309DRAFT_378251 [Dichomitus squalens]